MIIWCVLRGRKFTSRKSYVNRSNKGKIYILTSLNQTLNDVKTINRDVREGTLIIILKLSFKQPYKDE